MEAGEKKNERRRDKDTSAAVAADREAGESLGINSR